jgi:hypothetical protein
MRSLSAYRQSMGFAGPEHVRTAVDSGWEGGAQPARGSDPGSRCIEEGRAIPVSRLPPVRQVRRSRTRSADV